MIQQAKGLSGVSGIIGIIILFFLLNSCKPDYVYKELFPVDVESWTYGDSLVFEPQISDTTSLYDISLYLEHLKSYPFENLYIRMNYENGDKLLTDTLTYTLIGRDGLYIGSCDEESCRMEATILYGIKFSRTETQRFTIEQFTRESKLKGIQSVGLIIRERPRQ